VLVAVAGIEVSLLAVLVVAQRDLLALALGLIILTGLALWLGRARLGAARLPVRGWLGAGWGGLLVLALVFTDIAAYTATGALSNLVSHEGLLDLATPAALAVLSLTGLAAVVALGVSLRRAQPEAGCPPWVVAAALVVFGPWSAPAAGSASSPAAAQHRHPQYQQYEVLEPRSPGCGRHRHLGLEQRPVLAHLHGRCAGRQCPGPRRWRARDHL
jgi:hypothetical protein